MFLESLLAGFTCACLNCDVIWGLSDEPISALLTEVLFYGKHRRCEGQPPETDAICLNTGNKC